MTYFVFSLQRNYTTRTYGHISHIQTYFGPAIRIDEGFMQLWESVGFDHFRQCLDSMTATAGDKQFTFGLLEWW